VRLHLKKFLNLLRKEIAFKRKNEKKESGINEGVVRPKGNGIKDGNEKRLLCLCRKLLADYNQQQSTPDNFAFAFVHFSKTITR
jgi:hypothetical protein